MAPPRSAGRRPDQRARLMALTRAAYTVSEGGMPTGAAATWDGDGEGDREGDGKGVVGGAGGPPGAVRHGRRPARRRLGPRGALALAVVLALTTAFLVVRAVVTAASVVEVPVVEVPAVEAAAPSEASVSQEAPGSPGETTAAPAAPAGTTADVGPTAGAPPGSEPAAPAGDVVVHVSGRVLTPGVVTLPAGARVNDAVTAAGGADGDADLDAINLARVLVDGEQIHVPAPGEVVAAPAAPAVPSGPAAGATGSGDGGAAPPGLVNLNTAGIAELDELPGVGPAIAQRIIDWREANGGFQDVAELDEVSGIGPSLMGSLRDLVTV